MECQAEQEIIVVSSINTESSENLIKELGYINGRPIIFNYDCLETICKVDYVNDGDCVASDDPSASTYWKVVNNMWVCVYEKSFENFTHVKSFDVMSNKRAMKFDHVVFRKC